MLLPEETFPSITVYQFVQSLIDSAEGSPSLLSDFIIVDVNDYPKYEKEHLIGAYFYNRALLARNHFETQFITEAKIKGVKIVIYGDGGERVTSTLYERGYNAVLLRGNIVHFKSVFKSGLYSTHGESFDIGSLRNILIQLRKNKGSKGKLFHPTYSSRSRSVDRNVRSKEKGRPISAKRPWIPP